MLADYSVRVCVFVCVCVNNYRTANYMWWNLDAYNLKANNLNFCFDELVVVVIFKVLKPEWWRVDVFCNVTLVVG